MSFVCVYVFVCVCFCVCLLALQVCISCVCFVLFWMSLLIFLMFHSHLFVLSISPVFLRKRMSTKHDRHLREDLRGIIAREIIAKIHRAKITLFSVKILIFSFRAIV